jgi:predicted dehydrogenase
MRFIIFGAGSIGQRHMRNLRSLAHHTPLVWDPNPGRMAEIRRIDPETRFTTSEGEAISEPCDALLICSPTADHIRQLELALDNGKDVFVEKPLSHTLERTAALVALAEQVGSVVLVGCNMRFFPSLLLVKQLVDSGEVGRPLSVRAFFGFYLPYWRPGMDYQEGYGAQAKLGGGVILDCIHELDFMRWLFGEPVEVLCMAGKVSELEIDTEDLATSLIRFESGLIAELHLDYLQPTYRRGMEIIGEARTIVWDYIEQTVRLYTRRNNTYQVFQENINTERNYMYLREMEHFEKCLRREARPEQDLREARAALMLAEAMKRSAREKRLVRLTEFNE